MTRDAAKRAAEHAAREAYPSWQVGCRLCDDVIEGVDALGVYHAMHGHLLHCH